MTARRRVFALTAIACVALGACGGGSSSKADVGDAAPAFSTYDLNGNPVRLASFRGKTVVLNFWASWCVPCRKEFPLLAQVAKRPDVVVLGVVYNDSDANAKAFIAAHGGTWPGLRDDGRIARAYRVGPGIPSTIVINPKGVITVRRIGELRSVSDV